MSTQLQLRGGTTAETLLFTGAQREVTVDTDKNTLVVHDGVTAGGFPLATEEQVADGTFYYNDDVGGGSAADAYILVPKPNTNTPNSYQDGIQLGFVTANPNTGPSTANFQDLGVKNIKYAGGSDPAPGDISGRVNLIYDAGNDWLELQRKASGTPPQLWTVDGSVSANALTVSLQPCTIDFRSPTLDSGTVLTGVVTSAITLTVPSGATLGTESGVQSKIVIVAIYNAGVVELAVINLGGGVELDESSLINTTAVSGAASSPSTFYSATARSGVPYRVMGYVQSTQAAAGTWATSPSQVQGQGGQAIIKTDRFLHVRDQKASGTDGGTFTSGAWRTRDLNTVLTNTIPGASLVSNQITLPAGTYEVDALAPHYQNGSSNATIAKARIYDITGSAQLATGPHTRINGSSAAGQLLSPARGRFMLAVASVVELQHYTTQTKNTDGFGAAMSIGEPEIYSDVIIRRIS